MIALIAAFTLIASQDQEWPNNVTLGNWTYYAAGGNDGEILQLFQPGPQRGMIWVRYEYRSIQPSGFRSTRSLSEINCSTQQSRVVQAEAFAESNLAGNSIPYLLNPAWNYIAPDTLGSNLLEYGCGD